MEEYDSRDLGVVERARRVRRAQKELDTAVAEEEVANQVRLRATEAHRSASIRLDQESAALQREALHESDGP